GAFQRCASCLHEHVNKTLRRHGVKKRMPVEGKKGGAPEVACAALWAALDQIQPYLFPQPLDRSFWVLPCLEKTTGGGEVLTAAWSTALGSYEVALRHTGRFYGVAVEHQKPEHLVAWVDGLKRGRTLVCAWLEELANAAGDNRRGAPCKYPQMISYALQLLK